MKLRSYVLAAAALCGAHAAADAAERKEPAETNVRIERVEKESKESPAAGPSGEAEAAERARVEAVTRLAVPVPTPLVRLQGDETFQKAYADVYRILSEDNDCSRFFGGREVAARVFNGLAARLKPARLGSVRTGSTMTGGSYDVLHAPTGHKSRLFEKSFINSDGPFYRRRIAQGAAVPDIGSYQPATREARALILLHELGHLLRGADGGWLLEDDGGDELLSKRNTALVERNCGDELKALSAPPARPQAEEDESAQRHAAESGSQSPD